jgi:prophage regulatory protein
MDYLGRPRSSSRKSGAQRILNMSIQRKNLAETAGGLKAVKTDLNDRAIHQREHGQVFLRRRAVEARTGLSRSSIYDLIAAGRFPKPVPLGRRTVAWIEAEVTDWQKHRVIERDRPRTRSSPPQR